MNKDVVPRWLQWARQIQAVSQTGLFYDNTRWDSERYQRMMEIAAEIVETYTDLPAESVMETFAVQPGYATPKVDVRGAVIRDGKILLVQEREDEGWCMPGGWADVGDLPSEMVVREVWEESGFRVEPRKLAGVFNENSSSQPEKFFHAYRLVFLCEITGGEARPSNETLRVAFFPFDDLPPLSFTRTDERQLAEVEAHLHDPGRPAAFD